MPVDFSKKRKILVIHGVQRGDNDDQTQHHVIKDNVEKSLADIDIEFDTDIFKYEDINDEAVDIVKKALAALTGNVVQDWIVSSAIDIIGDVALALSEGSAYKEIKEKFEEKIIESYNKGEPLYIVAHSLGTIYAFDVLNSLMKNHEYFKYNQKDTWPVQGMITLGSPISLDLFDRDWQDMTNLIPETQGVNDDTKLFPWRNYWDPTDPIVSGSIVGLPWNENKFKEKFGDKPYDLGWDLRSRSIITQKYHIAAHTAYWEDSTVGLGLRQMLVRG